MRNFRLLEGRLLPYVIGLVTLLGVTLSVVACSKQDANSVPHPNAAGSNIKATAAITQPTASEIAPRHEQLSEAAQHVLFSEGTERSGSSPLLKEKRSGTYVCAACGASLFKSNDKYASGTGWPSFSEAIPGALETKRDYKLIVPRTEYHCAKCGAHQGHVFDDGPTETGDRFCNNGVALEFIPDASEPSQAP